MIAPFTRGLQKGMKGSDVLALERALVRVGVLHGKPDNVFGPGTSAAVALFQTKHHLKPASGMYGPLTHRALVKAGGYDARGAAMMEAVRKALTKHSGGRPAIREAALLMIRHTAVVHYTQTPKRMQIVRTRLNTVAKLRAQLAHYLFEDCSSSTTGLYYIGGVPDPNGLGYNGQGYTGTMTNHGRRSRSAPFGALVFYAGRSGAVGHVTMSLGDGTCFSHGNESAPQRLPINYRPIHSIRVYW